MLDTAIHKEYDRVMITFDAAGKEVYMVLPHHLKNILREHFSDMLNADILETGQIRCEVMKPGHTYIQTD